MTLGELRQDPVSQEWVVIAKARAQRPEKFKREKEKRNYKKEIAECPFEDLEKNPQEKDTLIYYKDFPKNWTVRSFPNKFPAFAPDKKLDFQKKGIYLSLEAVGFHEVVLFRDHKRPEALMSSKEITEIFRAYRERYNDLKRKETVRYIQIIQNHGKESGASIVHPHSQIFAIPVIPDDRLVSLKNAEDYYLEHQSCGFCDILTQEEKEKKRIIFANSDFVVFCPFASRFPFEICIMPRRHDAHFENITERELQSLGAAQKQALSRLYYGLNDVSYNYYLHTTSPDVVFYEHYHWHIRIAPRIEVWGGFEMGTGLEINTVFPEDAAKFLRKVQNKS